MTEARPTQLLSPRKPRAPPVDCLSHFAFKRGLGHKKSGRRHDSQHPHNNNTNNTFSQSAPLGKSVSRLASTAAAKAVKSASQEGGGGGKPPWRLLGG